MIKCLYSYRGIFYTKHNTGGDCDGAYKLSEERRNYAVWRQDAAHIIEAAKNANPLGEGDEFLAAMKKPSFME